MNKYLPPGTRKVPFKWNFGGERKIHVANDLDQAIYVLPSPSMSSAILNLFTSSASMGMSGRETLQPSPKSALKNFNDIKGFVDRLELAKLTYRAASSSQGQEARGALADYLKSNAKLIRPHEAQEILKRDIWKPESFGSAFETLFNSDSICLLLATESLDRVVFFNCGADDSWIFRQDGVVRSKFGKSLWEPDPSAGFVHVSRGDRLPSGSWLEPGESLTSPNGRYVFIYQKDGNAVVYDVRDKTSHKAIWASNTGGTTAWRLEMQSSGKVVVWSGEGREAWSDGRSKTSQATHYQSCELVMTDDGIARVMGANGFWGWDTIWKG